MTEWLHGDGAWLLKDDPEYKTNGAMARFWYWVCDQSFRIAEWFAWGRFE